MVELWANHCCTYDSAVNRLQSQRYRSMYRWLGGHMDEIWNTDVMTSQSHQTLSCLLHYVAISHACTYQTSLHHTFKWGDIQHYIPKDERRHTYFWTKFGFCFRVNRERFDTSEKVTLVFMLCFLKVMLLLGVNFYGRAPLPSSGSHFQTVFVRNFLKVSIFTHLKYNSKLKRGFMKK